MTLKNQIRLDYMACARRSVIFGSTVRTPRGSSCSLPSASVTESQVAGGCVDHYDVGAIVISEACRSQRGRAHGEVWGAIMMISLLRSFVRSGSRGTPVGSDSLVRGTAASRATQRRFRVGLHSSTYASSQDRRHWTPQSRDDVTIAPYEFYP